MPVGGPGAAHLGRPAVVHRPGPGAVVAVVGLALFVLSVFVLPWVSAGGEDATLPEISDSLDAADEAGVLTPDQAQDADIIRGYAGGLGVYLLFAMGVGIVISTLVVVRSPALRVVAGLAAGSCLGLIIALVDRESAVGMKVIAALAAAGAAAYHGYVYVLIFVDPEVTPDPAIGAWTGFLAVAAVFTGCIIGTRTQTA